MPFFLKQNDLEEQTQETSAAEESLKKTRVLRMNTNSKNTKNIYFKLENAFFLETERHRRTNPRSECRRGIAQEIAEWKRVSFGWTQTRKIQKYIIQIKKRLFSLHRTT